MSAQIALRVASILTSGLSAGLLFGWMVSVIPGTSVVDDRTYIVTMQSINRRIINPMFLAIFLLTPLILAAAAIAHFRVGQTRRGIAFMAATGSYLIGVLAVTGAGNVPLNDALDEFDLATASTAATETRRRSYETPWNRWHNLRTVASIVTLALVTVGSLAGDTD